MLYAYSDLIILKYPPSLPFMFYFMLNCLVFHITTTLNNCQMGCLRCKREASFQAL